MAMEQMADVREGDGLVKFGKLNSFACAGPGIFSQM